MRRRSMVIAGVVAAAVILSGTGVALARSDGGHPVRTQVLTVAATPEPQAQGAQNTQVTLDATLYLPDGVGPAPAVLLAHGFGGSKDDLAAQATELAQNGYVVLAYTARGFGRSGGLIHLDAPDYEVADARAMIDLLAQRPEVLQDAPGDPRVGVAGGSYGGGLTLLLAGYDQRVDAIAPRITWNDLRQSLFPQFAVSPAAAQPQSTSAGLSATPAEPSLESAGVFKKVWAGIFFTPSGSALNAATAQPQPGGAPRPSATAQACGRFTPALCAAYQSAAATGRPTQQILDLLAASSPARILRKIKAPTLLIQGEADSLFPLSEADANARGIAANHTPVKVVWYGGGHDGGLDESQRLNTMTRSWFDRYLKRDGSAPDTRFAVTVPAAVISSADSNPAPEIRETDGEPGVTSSAPLTTRAIPLTGPAQTVVAPAGGSPAAITALPGLGSLIGSAGGALGLSALPGQSARFETQQLRQALPLVGASRVTLSVAAANPQSSEATLFAQLYDVSASGSATLPQQLVSPMHLTGLSTTPQQVTITLPAVVRDIAAGHRARLVISTTDQGYALPVNPAQYSIALGAQPALVVPLTDTKATTDDGLRSLLPWALALFGAILIGLLSAAVLGRRRRGEPADPELEHVPLTIEGLGKAYGDGYRAVSDLSFRVEQGWVLGLLGPNGAGKTTTLRMLTGLISPSEGGIRVFGHQVRAGAPVLSRVGAFIEGPGFMPHVSGLANLTLYWQATGRAMAEAHLEEALEIAGLGDDVHRRVKTYSQGMRQRLAIAQSMLGLPDLLVLDEPTNGLDPPQIREMREVLARYAASGRTVVISSHLLAEVEQTCSHVVVMHQGRLVAQGPVAELVGSAVSLVIDVDDPQRAAKVAAGIEGARNVEVTETGLTLELIGTARAVLVRALVEADVQVDRVAPQRGLEEAFLALVGES